MAIDTIEPISGPLMARSSLRSETSPRSRTLEYRLYFALIFALAAPLALGRWLFALVTGNRCEMRKGVLRRAIAEAKTTTPFIFSVR